MTVAGESFVHIEIFKKTLKCNFIANDVTNIIAGIFRFRELE